MFFGLGRANSAPDIDEPAAVAAAEQWSLRPKVIVGGALTMHSMVGRKADDENRSQSLLDRRVVQRLKASTDWGVLSQRST